jgi:hypothetical protein
VALQPPQRDSVNRFGRPDGQCVITVK